MKSTLKGKFGPLLIAEIGGNHEGNFEYAKELCRQAIATGVDIVKFQIYTGDSLVSREESKSRNEHFKKFELTKEQHIELAQMVVDAGLRYTSSVWDMRAMSWIDPFIEVYKIGSGDLTAYPILKETANRGKPIILSTGLASEEEVLDAVSYIQDCNEKYRQSDMLAILQCTSMYPINNTDANLAVIKTFKDKTGMTVGYSDHTVGIRALTVAAAMGAEILEFHFTDSREGKVFRDHLVSLIPEEIHELIEELELIRTLKGNTKKFLTNIEKENGHDLSFRRAVYPNKDMQAGKVITEEDLIVLRPNHGIDAREYDNLLGKVLITEVRKHQRLNWEMFE